jgi:hypothetical protein
MGSRLAMRGDLRRAVFGTAVGYDAPKVGTFIKSLRSVGYSGDVVLLIGPTQFRLRTYLHNRGVKTVPVWCIRRIHGPIFTYRFEILADYLRRHAHRYSQVLLSDVRDVVFQRHPFEGITERGCHFFLEASDRTIGSEPSNLRWMQTFLTPREVDELRDRRISCCGVSLGDTQSMLKYLDHVAAYLRSVPLKIRRRHGADTAFHNLIAHFDDNVDRVIVENNRHVATMGIEPPSTYLVGPDNRVRTRDGHVPAILHQYDRLPEIGPAIEALYSPTLAMA